MPASTIRQQILLQLLARGTTSNVIYSPLSFEICLYILLAGSKGDVQQLLLQEFGIRASEIACTLDALRSDIARLQASNNLELVVNNNLSFDEALHCPNAFQQRVGNLFGLSINKSQPIAAQLTEQLGPASQTFALTNSLQLHAPWEEHFGAYPLVSDLFECANGERIETPYMALNQDTDCGKTEAAWLETADFSALRLIMKEKSLAVEFYLPKPDKSLKNLVEAYQSGQYSSWAGSFEPINYFYCMLPSFEFENEISIDTLANIEELKQLQRPTHDWTAMLNAELPLQIIDLRQRASIQVCKTGIKTGAITQAVGVGIGNPQSHPFKIFLATRAFMFLVREVVSNRQLFVGTLVSPPDGPERSRQLRARSFSTEQLLGIYFNMSIAIAARCVELAMHEANIENYYAASFLEVAWAFAGAPSPNNESKYELPEYKALINSCKKIQRLCYEKEEEPANDKAALQLKLGTKLGNQPKAHWLTGLTNMAEAIENNAFTDLAYEVYQNVYLPPSKLPHLHSLTSWQRNEQEHWGPPVTREVLEDVCNQEISIPPPLTQGEQEQRAQFNRVFFLENELWYITIRARVALLLKTVELMPLATVQQFPWFNRIWADLWFVVENDIDLRTSPEMSRLDQIQLFPLGYYSDTDECSQWANIELANPTLARLVNIACGLLVQWRNQLQPTNEGIPFLPNIPGGAGVNELYSVTKNGFALPTVDRLAQYTIKGEDLLGPTISRASLE